MKNTEKTMEKIVALCKNRGFVFPGSEIYGGLANSWDYGPLGVELKNNIKKAWWKKFVQENPYIYLSVEGDDMVFQVTACFITDISFDYISPDLAGEELTGLLRQVEEKNWLAFDGVTFSEKDTILTLSTCCRKYDMENTGDQRLVVMAKLLPEGATAQEFSVSLVDSPEMP